MLHSKGLLRSCLQFCLTCAGKGEKKVASVFSVSAAASQQAVLHLRQGAPDIPIWLFTTVDPGAETAALCQHVSRNENPWKLAASAQQHLWSHWVAISVVTWTGSGGAWSLKLAPFLAPPFRILILNRGGGFFRPTPSNLVTHAVHASMDAARRVRAVYRKKDHAARVAIHNFRVRLSEEIRDTPDRVRWFFHPAQVRLHDLVNGFSKLSAAIALRAASATLRWMSNPHFDLLASRHGDQPLLLDVEPAAQEGLVLFRQSGPDWNGEEFEKAARSSDARWILWQTGEDADTISRATSLFDEGNTLFIDNRTFAASRQTHFRGWKKVVAPTAPFRTLQSGEATRVLAPLSGSILFDRKKVLALGIPRCSMPGTAWLILFWKAAAAGWRSYSLGPSAAAGKLSEQPEYPIQDTAFVLETFADRALRSLCPRQPELSRGNIGFETASFAPALERLKDWDSRRLKVLIVSPFLPYPLSHGGAVRIFNLCRELSDRVDFTLIAVREANDHVDYGKLHQVFREVHIVDKDERPLHDKRLPFQVSSSESSSLRALITQLSQKLLPDLIQFEYTHFAGFRDCAPGVPAVLVEHDLTFSLYRQLAETNASPEAWQEYRRWLAFERKWLAAYEGVWTVSEEDRLRAIDEGRRAPDRTFSIANGVDLDRFKPTVAADGVPEVLYVGSFRHLPNIIGFEKLCDQVMPRVWQQAPDTRLRIVAGPEHPRYWRQFGRKTDLCALDPRIVIHGFVENLQPLYDRASVVAVPLEVSAGTNIKVLEAMACGKAIVSTPIGCAGLNLHDGFDIAVRQDWAEFADALATLLSEPELRASLGVCARRTAENNFGWTAIANRAYESYLSVIATPAHSRRTANRPLTVA